MSYYDAHVESEKSTDVSEVSSLKSQNATLQETISRQKMRIETLETTNKDTLALLEKKSSDIARNEEEYKEFHAKYIESRRELANTETALQEAQGQISTLTYKEQSLHQEVEFLKRDNDRLANELNTKASDFSNYRKEKSTQVSQLESELEEASSNSTANAEQNRSLKRRLEETSQKLERALAKNAELSDQVSSQVENHRSELSSQTRLAELWERSCKETQQRNRDLENQLEREQERTAEEVAQWQVRAQAEEARALEAESRVQELEREVERLEATLETNAAVALHSPTGPNGHGRAGFSTPSNRAAFSPTSSTGMFSPSAQAIEKRGRSGMSLTQLYSELHTAKQAETLQRRRADKLQEEYEQYREEAERWAPEYQNVIQEFERQKEDLATMSINLQNAITEKEEAERQLRLMRNSIMDKERETRLYHQRSPCCYVSN
jgi:nucleoprotein TPR